MENKTPIYDAPQVEIMELEIEEAVLRASNVEPQDGQGW